MNSRDRVLAAAIILQVLSCPAFTADKKKPKPLSAAEVFKRSTPAIVAIDCLGDKSAKIGTASGFIVADNGKIVTNLHVIQQCSGLAIRLSNGDIYDTANVIETDQRRDLALIRIKAASLPVLTLADSNDVEVGQMVYSIGNPSGLQNTLQQGLVSAFREMQGYRLIQVSASINPGNSGGPILDDQGHVIAIAAMKITGAENLGFAIPINYAKGYLDTKTETTFPVFAAQMKRLLALNNAKTAPAAPVGGVPGGVVGGVAAGGIASGIGGAAPPPPPPPSSTAPNFTTIETIAGGDWKFIGEGLPALQVPLGHVRGVAYDRAGNIYATDIASNVIVRIDAGGRLHILAGPDSAPQNRPSSPSGIAIDPSGAVYFGEDGQRVRKILPSGEVVVLAGSDKRGFSPDGSPAAGSAIAAVTGMAVGPDGTVMFSEFQNNRVRRIDFNGRLQTVAGDGQRRFAGDGGPATQASLANPAGIAIDRAGNVFIADQANGRVRKVAPDGRISTVVGPGVTKDVPQCPSGVAVNGNGDLFVSDPCKRQVLVVRNGQSSILGGVGTSLKEPSGQGGPATAASFDEYGLAINDKDDLIIAGQDYGRVYRINRQGIFSIMAGSGDWRAPSDGTPARNAWFQRPSSLAIDRAGSIFVTDPDASRIYRIDRGGTITRLAGAGHDFYSGENVTAKESPIIRPLRLRVRPDGTVVFSERGGSNRIREITPDGKLRTLAGNGKGEYSGDGGRATNAAFASPFGICFDSSGNTYIADTDNNRVRKVTPDGIIQLVAGNGVRGFSGDGGPAERASLNTPTEVEIGPDGSLYILDYANHRVRKVSNGIITTIAGNGAAGFAGDGGPATAASLNSPSGLAFGPDRALYVADASRVRRIDTSGRITTVAGNGTRTISGDGGSPLQAGLGQPESLAFDASGNLYISENLTGRIRVVRTAAGATTPPK